ITTFPEIVRNDLLPVIVIICAIGVAAIGFTLLFILSFLLRKMGKFITTRFLSPTGKKVYEKVVASYQGWLGLVAVLSLVDLTLLLVAKPIWLKYLEVCLALTVAVTVGWLLSRLFDKFFETFLAETVLSRKINGELLVVGNIVADTAIFLTVFFIFAQTHQINLIGLTASLGLGGLAVAFAAQETLQQLLGGIVLYIDRPFVIDDYIGLPDGTFGRVESIGLRSTKIRNSGKGTVTIVPNNSLTQMSIENFTGAKKVVSLVYLTFYREVLEDEQALICQVILESAKEIFGIDPRSTEVNFKDITQDGKATITQAQINFFILGSGEMSMDMRRQLIDMAKESITLRLKEYGIAFDLEEQQVNVDAPITI
ncbi:MAG: mechanosensitive ion channel, partial [Scytonema sp. PMC 1069.18]|nr:mechanosensitive ion channel [Scytonema sp. PMC 1069.18]